MKDEEMAEEYANNIDYTKTVKIFDCVPYHENCDVADMVAQAFLAGLKAGRPQWHDLRKDPNDLPDEGTYLIVWRDDYGYKEIFMMNYEEDDEEELHWVDGDCEVQDEHIIAWCEIPTFDKEIEK